VWVINVAMTNDKVQNPKGKGGSFSRREGIPSFTIEIKAQNYE
jgi:hypothetical protein